MPGRRGAVARGCVIDGLTSATLRGIGWEGDLDQMRAGRSTELT